MDLHDGIIQSLYAIGLLLDDARHRLDSDPEKARVGLGTAINGLNNTIQDIRNYISDLRPQRFQGRNVKQGLEQLAQELRTDTLFAVRLNVDPQAAAACTARQANEFLHIAQEALANIRKHAEATTIQMRFQFSDGLLQMTIQDDGIGFDQAQARRAAATACATCANGHGRCTANFAASPGLAKAPRSSSRPPSRSATRNGTDGGAAQGLNTCPLSPVTIAPRSCLPIHVN